MQEKIKTHNPLSRNQISPFEALPGIFRQTLAYTRDTMLCFFHLNKGADIPLHNHPNVQIGYIIKGKVKFLSEYPTHEFIATLGDSYIFDKHEKHGANAMEDTDLIEVFHPYRPEYEPQL